MLLIPLDRLLHRSAHFDSRDDARAAIAAGRVSLGTAAGISRNELIDPAAVVVRVDGARLPPPPPCTYVALHKPVDMLTTLSDADTSERRRREGRQLPSVGTLLRAAALPPHVAPVGRLDADSEGLLLATNDGALAHALLQPGGPPRRYLAAVRARRGMRSADGDRGAALCASLERGFELPGGRRALRAERATVLDAQTAAERGAHLFDDLLHDDDDEVEEEQQQLYRQVAGVGGGDRHDPAGASSDGGDRGGLGGGEEPRLLVEVTMRQGAKREVRRLLRAAGFETRRLCRVALGPLALRERAGELRHLEEVEVLRLYRAAFPPCLPRGAGALGGAAGGDAHALARHPQAGGTSTTAPAPPLLPVYDSERGDWVHPHERLARLEASVGG